MIAALPVSSQLVVGFPQAMPVSLQLLVKPGEFVLRGQPLLRPAPEDLIGVPVFAPSSGVVTKIIVKPYPQITLTTDGQDQPWPYSPPVWAALSRDARLDYLRQGGIVGLGGALFPVFRKLQGLTALNALIINAAASEPEVGCDGQLLQDHPEMVLAGMQALCSLFPVRRCILALAERYNAMIARLDFPDAEIRLVPAHYPAGSERQLIQYLLGLEIPSGQYPSALGIACFNVGTVRAIGQWVKVAQPLISRVVTVTGAVKESANLEVRLGTPLADMITYCGGYTTQRPQLWSGGSLMSSPLPHAQMPLSPAHYCIRVAAGELLENMPLERACIRCGACAEVCPMRLLPQQLYWYSRAQQWGRASALNLRDCIECGACQAVCPSQIPLVRYYQRAKQQVLQQQSTQQQAALAKQRTQQREQRLQQEQAQRKAAQAQYKAAIAQTTAADKQAMIAGMLKRAQAKQRSPALAVPEAKSEP